MAAVGKAFGLSILQSVRAGLLLAAGGEFAFVTFGEAVSHKILPQALVSKLFLIVSLSMALTPFLAEFGQRLGKMFEKSDVKVLPLCLDLCNRCAITGCCLFGVVWLGARLMHFLVGVGQGLGQMLRTVMSR